MKKPTLAIGIPAHNEGKNIGSLLESILKQQQTFYVLESVIVVCDGFADNTVSVVKEFTQNHRYIKLLAFNKRLGKSVALNKIYALCKSDFLLTFDADVVLERSIEIELMIKEMLRDDKINLVGGRFILVKQKTLMGKLSYVSFVSFEDAFLKLNGGNNFFALVGAASLIRKRLYKSFTYPKATISDQNYLFAMALRIDQRGFRVAKDTRILMRPVSTFNDWRTLGARSVVADKENIAHFLGKGILQRYYMPRSLYFKSLLKWFFKTPFYTTGAIAMNIFIRAFPYRKAVHTDGTWDLTHSSKETIVSEQSQD